MNSESRQQFDAITNQSAVSSTWPPLSASMRLVCAIGSIAILTLIVVAAWLTPNVDGIGTHRGLGLPPCHWIEFLGVRCPACGMTTSWAWMTRGQLSNAASVNPAGALLFVQAVITAFFLGCWAITGKTWNAKAFGSFSCYFLVMNFTIALIYWGIRLKLG